MKGQTDNGWHFEQEVYDAEGIARVVKAGGGSGNIPKVIEPQVLTPKRTEEGKRMRKDYEAHKVTKQRKEMQQLEPREDGVSNTLTTAQKDNYLMEQKKKQYRIRKLTEREAFRLMGVKDEDSDKIRSVVSKSQCYKLAGNSIVVDVMVHMFDQLFFGNKNTNQQLELF